jgi:hypothetical protein
VNIENYIGFKAFVFFCFECAYISIFIYVAFDTIGEQREYVIIDDNENWLDEQRPYVVVTSWQTGLTKDKAMSIINILNN